MTEYIKGLLNFYIVKKEHHIFRSFNPKPDLLAEQFKARGLGDMERAVERLRWVLTQEKPVIPINEKIVMLRTVTEIPAIFTPEELETIKKSHNKSRSKVNNINPRYSLLLECGTRQKRTELEKQLVEFEKNGDTEGKRSLKAFEETLGILESFADKYREEALRIGNTIAAETFVRIPRERPNTFLEALQFLRLVHYSLWCSFNYHNTFGRFDQYMYPFYKHDIECGLLNQESALELIEEFFISCNKDSDLYHGIQQGDNGQSMVLGGLNPDGSESYNELSDLCLKASLELHLIDPKINLRVNKKTSLKMYYKGSVLTKQGLGFPQYCNDDVVIEALKRWGYKEKDAYDYVVAACWEFIVPGAGMDIVNFDSLSFSHTITAVFDRIDEWTSFDELLQIVKEEINRQANSIIDSTKNVYMEPAPFLSLLMDGCVENGRDISLGGIYNNYGIHGAGLSTAVDSLASIRKYVFEDKRISKKELRQILKNNYENANEWYTEFRYQTPKIGNDDDKVDELANKLLGWFADALEGKRNDRGGIFRAGTGSAMYYIWQSREEPATPDGRKHGDPLACNYSPSLFSRCKGPVSIIKSFTKPNLVRVANGGPLTIELHDTIFRNEDSTRKVGQFVKSFIDMGGHQMQINAVNRDTLKDAQKHPENYRNLIVRVWGWSGYFVELDEVYQNHIIERMELAL